jgi:hypothetical protein
MLLGRESVDNEFVRGVVKFLNGITGMKHYLLNFYRQHKSEIQFMAKSWTKMEFPAI